MLITVSLVNINYLTYNLFPHDVNIYSLGNFQIYDTVLLTLVTILYITSPELIFFKWLGKKRLVN